MGRKVLKDAKVQEAFGSFQAEGLSFHQMMSELLHKCEFIILFVPWVEWLQILACLEV